MAVPRTSIHISPKILHLAGRSSAAGRAACMLLSTTFALATFAQATKQPVLDASALYQLGLNDTILVHVKGEFEISDGPYVVDLQGHLTLPEIGTITAAGLPVTQLQDLITEQCKPLVKAPVVHVSIVDDRSQKIEVSGAVETPSVQQGCGRKTFSEVISEAGGLKPEAGGTIQLTREAKQGPLPLPGTHKDASGQFETATIDVDALMKVRTPGVNNEVRPNDVVTVGKVELVYVFDAVRRPGGVVLSGKNNLSVVQALSLAEGAERTAGRNYARVLRRSAPGAKSTDIPFDFSKLIAGKAPDFDLQASDMLVVPTSAEKSAMFRNLEAAVNTGSGVAIYHPL